MGRIGILKSINNKISVFLEFRFEQTMESSPTPEQQNQESLIFKHVLE